MRYPAIVAILLPALALSACNGSASGEASATAETAAAAAPTAPSAPTAPVAPPAPAAEAAAAAPAKADAAAPAAPAPAVWQRITITGFECGDNCYMTYRLANGQEDSAICTTPRCRDWFANQHMPDSEVGKSYDVQMGTTQQFDNEYRVMEEDFPAIVAMRAPR